MVHLELIPDKPTAVLRKALVNGYNGLGRWPSAREFIAAIEAELEKRGELEEKDA